MEVWLNGRFVDRDDAPEVRAPRGEPPDRSRPERDVRLRPGNHDAGQWRSAEGRGRVDQVRGRGLLTAGGGLRSTLLLVEDLELVGDCPDDRLPATQTRGRRDVVYEPA